MILYGRSRLLLNKLKLLSDLPFPKAEEDSKHVSPDNQDLISRFMLPLPKLKKIHLIDLYRSTYCFIGFNVFHMVVSIYDSSFEHRFSLIYRVLRALK
jgi:hypothetical protein